MREEMLRLFESRGLSGRVHFPGAVQQKELADCYAAMDVFAFSSLTETQGLVLAEAMAAGLPVVAIDAPGARELVSDMHNGCLLPEEASVEEFSEAIAFMRDGGRKRRDEMKENCRQTAAGYSQAITTGMTASLYRTIIEAAQLKKPQDARQLQATLEGLREEWRILQNLANAVKDAVIAPESDIA